MQNKKKLVAPKNCCRLSIQIYVTYSFIFTEEEKNKTQINVIVRLSKTEV